MARRDKGLQKAAAPLISYRARDIRRERLIMRVFQSPVFGRVVQRIAGPQQIVETGMAFWSSRLVLTAVECGVFTELAEGPRTRGELIEAFGWHPRAAGDALDALVALGLLRRDRSGRYSNAARSSIFLDRAKPSYAAGLMELSSKRLYGLWCGLPELLRTGRPAAEEGQGEDKFFSTLYRDPAAMREFLTGMTGVSTVEATLLAVRFPWKRFRTFVDVGTAQGALPVRVALTHRHLRGTGFDFAAVQPIFEDYVASFGLEDRIRFIAGDCLEEPLPRADVVSFGHVFHGYNQATRRELIDKAYAAIPPGGAVIVYDAMVDPGHRHNYASLLSSLNVMLETREGYESSVAECVEMFRAHGLVDVKARHLIGPTSAVFGYKPGQLPRAN